MNDILIAVSTYNRRDLTAVCLESIMACKDPGANVIVFDDRSTEYDLPWLTSLGPSLAVQPEGGGLGAGGMARLRIERFLATDWELLCLLDNDALVTPRFDTKLRALYEKFAHTWDGTSAIVTGYRSSGHEVDLWYPSEPGGPKDVALMKDIGGINMFMDRATARHLLDTIPVEEWDWKWDYKVCAAVPRLYAPTESWISHMGRWNPDSVNGISGDRAVNFIGYKRS